MRTQKKKRVHLTNKRKTIKRLFGGNNTVSGGGIFCYMPYNTLDIHNKSNFKIESGVNIKEQMKKLKIFFPDGFYVISILTSPTVGKKMIKSRKIYFRLIQDKIMEFAGAKTNSNDDGWIHCTIEKIHEAFKKAEKMYGGVREEFGLTGMMKDTLKLVEVKNSRKPVYVGKVIFHT